MDLDARLASARATEKRLTELLANRTGRLSDVLDVERELARVRLDIERLDAEKTNIGRRVTYATIGYGDLVLPREWRLLAPLEGLAGILMCGLSAGLFFATVTAIYMPREQAK